MRTSKVLVIGVDAATFDLIDPWVAEGLLPNFQRLMESGTRATLWTVPNLNSAPAWTSFATGKNPGKHGIFFFARPKLGTYEMEVINGSYRDSLTFWQIASEYDKHVGIINVPVTYPAEAVNGFMISGLDTPGKHVSGWTFPANLMEQTPPELGEYIIESGLPSYVSAGQIDRGLEVASRTIAQRTRYAVYLMQNSPWDLFVTVYTTTDAIQHYFWKQMIQLDGLGSQEYRFQHTIRDTYIQVDQAIGELLDNIPPGTTVIVLSDHGAGPTLRGSKELPGWLVERGFMQFRNAANKPILRTVASSLLRRSYQWVDAHLSRELKLFLGRKLPNVRSKVEANIKFGQVDWSSSRLYIGNVREELRVNLKGREPQGTVEPGEEYEALCNEVIAALLDWRDPQSGVPMVAGVKRREEAYTGPHLAGAGDLVIHWNYECEDLYDFAPPSLQARQLAYRTHVEAISGGHYPNGILIARGPDIQAAHEIREAYIWDIAPTVLYMLGLPIPKDMDGRLLRDMFTAETLTQHPPGYVDPEGSAVPAPETVLDYEDEELIKERLRGLGYID